jgi:thymidylate synthase
MRREDNQIEETGNEKQYLNLLREILVKGHYRKTRNGNTLSLFGKNLEFNLENQSFPLLTTKKMFLRGIFEELSFFLKGDTNSKNLEKKGVNIWKPNTTREFLDSVDLVDYDEGDMGPMYFYQIYHFNYPYSGCNNNYSEKGLNQMDNVIHLLRTDRFSRRIIMTTYNPLQAGEGVLYPCHGIVIQFAVEGDNRLCCQMYQRSGDCFLGIPFNIASYSLLLLFMVKYLNDTNDKNDFKFVPGKLCISIGDCHIYENHVASVEKQLSRKPFPFPKLNVKRVDDLKRVDFNDIELVDYECHPSIKIDMVA